MKYDRDALKAQYPWLLAWEDEKDYGLWTDYLPRGWQISFVPKFLEDLALALEKDGIAPEDYWVIEAKEKFGGLRWYDNGGVNVSEVKQFYETVSELTCIDCGKPAEWYSLGWICPYCTDCKDKLARMGTLFRAIT